MTKKQKKYFRLLLAFTLLALTIAGILYNFRYIGINRSIVIEAGTNIPEAKAFIKASGEDASYISDSSSIDIYAIGVYKLKIQSNDETYNVRLKIKDTIAPKAFPTELSISADQILNPADFVTDIKDVTPVVARYKNKPQFGKYGDYDVIIVLKDMGGNKTEISSKLHISKIKHLITIEAGESLPAANDYLTDENSTATFITDINKISTNAPGIYDIEVSLAGESFNSKLEIKDTIAPIAVIKQLDLYESRNVEPNEFVERITDATNVEISYKKAPDFTNTNNQTVVILLEDAAGNQTEYETKFRNSKVLETVRVEASNKELDIMMLLKNKSDSGNVRLLGSPFVLNRIGVFPIKLSINDIIYESNVEVIDTIAPEGKVKDQKIWFDDKIEASEFISEIIDATEVQVSFKEEPDYTIIGDQNVSILLQDLAHNESMLSAVLTIEEDKEPPVLYGVKDTTIYLNEPVSYKKNVYAVDNKDGELSVTVDSSNVNIRKEGSYKVIFSTSDSSGNIQRKEVTYTVKAFTVSIEELEVLADEILARITTENMTLREKSWEIYQYVNKHLTYTGVSDKTDWMKEAYSGIVKGVGDCFTYFSMSELLLNRIGMQTLRVERLTKPGESRHYWHMVNYGEGWYHFDACIHKPPYVTFMLTDAEIDAYSARVGKDNYYYRYDRENYPATPEK